MTNANKKVGLAIVTYTINYGTFLQAFATQMAIQKLGYETEIININSVIADVSKARRKYFMRRMFDISELWSYRHTIAAIIARRTNRKYRDYISSREECFQLFGEKYFNVGPKCDSWLGLTQYCEIFSSVVVGSDQLWRPANISGNFYTLNFVPDYINKVSYATSFGLNTIREEQKETATGFLQRIEHLSCREESGKKIIESLLNRKVKVVCDPTLLLRQSDWNLFVKDEPIVEGEYILVYLLGANKKHRAYVRKLAKETSCKIVGVLHGAGYIRGDRDFVDEAPTSVDPFDFLNLIKYAKYVCTDSFHGCVFSTIFEKNFYAFKRFSDKNHMSTNTRVTGLLEKLNLSGRLVTECEDVFFEDIDYIKVKENMDEYRAFSEEYLATALGKWN